MSVLPVIEEEFLNTGRMTLQVRPVAFLGEKSALAAEAAECASDQGRFWEFRDILFANQGSVEYTENGLVSPAELAGLDTAEFSACLSSGKYAESVRTATEAAVEAGIEEVPTMLVNGKKVPATVDDLRLAIQEELASAP